MRHLRRPLHCLPMQHRDRVERRRDRLLCEPLHLSLPTSLFVTGAVTPACLLMRHLSPLASQHSTSLTLAQSCWAHSPDIRRIAALTVQNTEIQPSTTPTGVL